MIPRRFQVVLNFSEAPSLPGIIAAEPDERVLETVAQSMVARPPLSNVYLMDNIDLEGFGNALANHLRAHSPCTAVSQETLDLRASYSFRAKHDPTVKIWHGGSASGWTLIAEEDSLFATPPAQHTLFLKPWPQDPQNAFRFVAEELQKILIFPENLEAPIAGIPVCSMLDA